MNEFEKWWDDYPVGGTKGDKKYALEGWIAALKWIKTRDGDCDYQTREIVDIVDEEIEEGEYARIFHTE